MKSAQTVEKHYYPEFSDASRDEKASEREKSILGFLARQPVTIELFTAGNKVSFYSISHGLNGFCPSCGKKISGIDALIAEWQSSGIDLPIKCENCEASTSSYQLNWKHTAAFASSSIIIHQIYPHEALPTEELLRELEEVTSFKWDFCYSKE